MGDLYEFSCPDCNELVYVDDRVRESLLSDGCLVCEADLSVHDFEEKPVEAARTG